MDCWDYMHCGREKKGENVDELGICPAYPEHGKHCAHVVGTLCAGRVQGTFADKEHSCLQCSYYNSIHYDKGYIDLKRLARYFEMCR